MEKGILNNKKEKPKDAVLITLANKIKSLENIQTTINATLTATIESVGILEIKMTEIIKDSLMNQATVKNLIDQVNSLSQQQKYFQDSIYTSFGWLVAFLSLVLVFGQKPTSKAKQNQKIKKVVSFAQPEKEEDITTAIFPKRRLQLNRRATWCSAAQPWKEN